MKQAKKNLLGTATPQMRVVALAIRKAQCSGRKTRCREVVRDLPAESTVGFVNARHLDEAIALADSMDDRRDSKKNRHINWRARAFYGPNWNMMEGAAGKLRHERVLLAEQLNFPIRDRLTYRREQLALPAARWVMKHGAPGGTHFVVRIAEVASYEVRTEKNWVRVNRGKDHWASLSDTHFIDLLPTWTATVRRLGMATVADRWFILDATMFVETPGRSVWEARVTRTGRGYQAVVERVWLSFYGKAVTVHTSLHAALNAKPPVLQVEIERPLPDEDDAALSALAFA
ncbi:hypothetical protein ASF24_15195 [Methylobacterium sp. Leaf86]|uniref:hypothetical protein n=1 Tax=Methylobacterium sp. Leaf86 TaxID=1736242 RepID=UPI0006FF7B34|nr:hypothetical protein [Methylobacterium sp. Leaf86]KQO57992.1 hypothetical protein ASF24_15195 [Methylobacterium sp. Leaf86]